MSQTRNKSTLWQVITYVPREKNHYSQNEMGKFAPALKTFRMQQLYNATLSSLVNAQKPGALNKVQLQLGNKEKKVNLKYQLCIYRVFSHLLSLTVQINVSYSGNKKNCSKPSHTDKLYICECTLVCLYLKDSAYCYNKTYLSKQLN